MTEIITPIYFSWNTFMPDHRQYKQNSINLSPMEIYVVVDLPIRKEYVRNYERLLAAGLNADKIDPELTPLGMRYCMDQLESVLLDVPLQATDFGADVDNEKEWNDGWEKSDVHGVEEDEEGW